MKFLLADVWLVGWNGHAALTQAFEAKWALCLLFLGFAALFGWLATINWNNAKAYVQADVESASGIRVHVSSPNPTAVQAALRAVDEFDRRTGGAS